MDKTFQIKPFHEISVFEADKSNEELDEYVNKKLNSQLVSKK